jgi:hypothetical protein
MSATGTVIVHTPFANDDCGSGTPVRVVRLTAAAPVLSVPTR